MNFLQEVGLSTSNSRPTGGANVGSPFIANDFNAFLCHNGVYH